MAQRDNPKTSSLAGNLAFFAFIIGVIVFFTFQMMGPSDDPIRQRQLDPESALTVYIEKADDFRSFVPGPGARVTFADVQKTVTREDWDWYQDKYANIYADAGSDFGITDSIDPTAGETIKRIVSLQGLQSAGPSRKDATIKEIRTNGDKAEAYVIEKDFSVAGGSVDYNQYRIDLIKEGKYWKVKDFAGGRAEVENRRKPEDVQILTQEEVQGIVPGAGAGGDPAAADPATAAAQAQAEAEAAAAGANGANANGGGTNGGEGQAANGGASRVPQNEQAADKWVADARRYWQTGDPARAYGAALLAFTWYNQNLGPEHQKTVQTRQMGTQARNIMTQQGIPIPSMDQIIANMASGNGASGNGGANGAAQPGNNTASGAPPGIGGRK